MVGGFGAPTVYHIRPLSCCIVIECMLIRGSSHYTHNNLALVDRLSPNYLHVRIHVVLFSAGLKLSIGGDETYSTGLVKRGMLHDVYLYIRTELSNHTTVMVVVMM